MGRAAGRCGASRAAPARRDAAQRSATQRNVPRSSGARRRSSRFVAPACCLHPAPIVATHAARRRPTTHAASRRGAGRHLARPMQACAPERASRANRQAAGASIARGTRPYPVRLAARHKRHSTRHRRSAGTIRTRCERGGAYRPRPARGTDGHVDARAALRRPCRVDTVSTCHGCRCDAAHAFTAFSVFSTCLSGDRLVYS